MEILVLFGVLFLLLAIGVPVAFALLAASIACFAAVGIPPLVAVQRMASGISVFALMAIPFFIFAGDLMYRSGIAERLVRAADAAFGRVRGGLGIVDVGASMGFGAVSGSAIASASAIGSTMVPLMKEKGYPADYAVNVTSTAAIVGLLIPPSHNMIIYSAASGIGVSVGDLFLAGVGRDEELRLLKDQLHAADRERKLRVVAITAQAGMGKSRLAWELEKYLDGLAGPLYYWHQGRSPAYGEGVTYWALGEMVRRRARIVEGEAENATREKLRAALAEFVSNDDERRLLEPALGGLLGIDEADWEAREQLFTAWRTFFERIAEKGTTILVFEDLQWADSALLDFIEHLLEWTRDKPIFIVTLARPEFLERRPNFGVGHRAFAAQRLEPMSDEAMAELLRGVVPELADADLARIVSHAEGVPLFAVETVRSLVDSGHLERRGDTYVATGDLPTLDIPPSLRALIASRLDALPPDDRNLIQKASVLGLVFSVAALAALSDTPREQIDERLRDLARKELLALETDPRSPERGQYRFRQGLIREVAYGTLGKRERRGLHLAAARYFETLGDEELAGVLANHYLEAYQSAPEGEEAAAVAAQARVALRAAAERASRLHAQEQAVAYYEKAIAVTFDEDDQTELMRLAAASADAAGQLEKSEALLREAIRRYLQRGEMVRAAQTTEALASRLLESSRIDEAMELLVHGLANLTADEVHTTISLKGQLARGHMFRDEPERALVLVSEALEAGETLDAGGLTLQLIVTKSWALTSLGRHREATALLMGAYWLADDEGELWARVRTRYNAPGYMMLRDPHRSLQFALEGVAIAQQNGLSTIATMQAGNAADAALAIGDLERVFELESSVAVIKTPMAALIQGAAAGAAALRGDLEGAHRRLGLLQEQYADSDSAQDRMAVRAAEAMVALGAGELREARRLALESRDAYRGGQGVRSGLLAGSVAALVGDIDALRSDLAWLADLPRAGAWQERSIRTLTAACQALEGRAGDALRAYAQLIEAWRTAELPLDLAMTLLERSRLLGHVDPDAAAGRDEAGEIFAAMGAAGFMERIEAAAGPAVPPKPAPAASRPPADVAAAQH